MSRTVPTVNLRKCETHVILHAILSDASVLRLGSASLENIPEPDSLEHTYLAKIIKDSQVKLSSTSAADQMTLDAENADKALGLTLNDTSRTMVGAEVRCSKVFTDIVIDTAATGTIDIATLPVDGDTITVNGVTFTYKNSPVGNMEIQIEGSAVVTATTTASKLNVAASHRVQSATYTVDAPRVITITHRLKGNQGNGFTLAKSSSHITVSGANLTGGGTPAKTWESKVLLVGTISDVNTDENVTSIKIVSDIAPNVAFISNRPIQSHCPLIFKGVRCGYAGGLTACNKVYESEDGCSGRNNQPRFGGIVIKGELPNIIPGGIDGHIGDPGRFGPPIKFPIPDDSRKMVRAD